MAHDRADATPLPLRRKVRGAAAAGRWAAVRWWLLSLAAIGATITADATLLVVALHVSSSSTSGPASSSGVPYRHSKLLLRAGWISSSRALVQIDDARCSRE
uniref:Auxin-independent growth promoter-like n=1 Tax=Oryza sativa subsp. japonica TaxID=39947 RepID=Q5Z6H7_ORYSJ|nr:auxin-independent growth promoter-like [Oryza sativa Japonica Group]BAD54442.1 auxin-independent growth promoter-like [Oryza sativa Japonica Group]